MSEYIETLDTGRSVGLVKKKTFTFGKPVVKQLRDGGYTDVTNLTWGMLAWRLLGGETVSGP